MTTSQQPQETSTGAPDDYRLLLPEGWYRIPLEPERCVRSVDVLVERQFKGVDDAPHLKKRVRDELLDQADKAIQNGGIEMYLSLIQVGPVPASASLIVTFIGSGPPATDLESVAADIQHSGAAGTEAAVVELPCGPAVRARSRAEIGRDESSGEVLSSTAVDYYLPIPHSQAFLLLSFSTPLEAIAEAMVGLFDAVAASFTWQGAFA
ncbi:hypothetical protein AB0O69_04270 [Streptomyces xiamenensis]|uniref:hypothetical protein n=1 Tax=Streptomyces xiamenensis TaxID=408015 RepID=UPI0034188B67